MPRILFVKRYHVSRVTGGAEAQCNMLAVELARRGWDVHYACEMTEVRPPYVVDGVTLHALPPCPAWRSTNRPLLRKLMAELNPDVVYNRSFDIYTGFSLLDAPKRTVKVWALGLEQDGFIGEYLIQLWKAFTLHDFLVRLPYHVYPRFIAKRGMRRADLVLAQSTEQQERLRRLGIEGVLLRNSHVPVPEEEIQQHEGRPVVLWVSSIKPWKRPELFIELARRCRDLEAAFAMVGAFQTPAYQPMVEAACRELPNFRYGGFIPFERVGRSFAESHLFVCTSVSEGFSNTFVQAWIRGVPVLSLGVDTDRLLQERGLGVFARDLDGLEQAVRDLVGHPEKRKEIGSRARAFALAEFDLQRNVDKLEQLLSERGVKPPGQA
jgi:glycosyltransferase involved in cell wall biosynthesis